MVLESEIIKMLATSKELQNKREFILGNMYYNAYKGKLEIIGMRYGNDKIFTSFNYPLRTNKHGYVWIPSQKQLQDIYYREYHNTLFKELNKDYNKLEITILSLSAIQKFVSLMAKFKVFFVNYYEIWINKYWKKFNIVTRDP